MTDRIEARVEKVLKEVHDFRKARIGRLRTINHWWNITFKLTGITLTAVATILGMVSNDRYREWLKVGIAVSGSVAVLSQSASQEFRVGKKASKYAKIEAELLVIEYRLKNLESESKLQELNEDFYSIIRLVGDIESQLLLEDDESSST